MILKIRSNSVTLYRLLFVALFLILGIAGIGIILLEQYAGITILTTDLEADREAFYIAASAVGVFGLFTSSLMFYLMQERRDPGFDRRQYAEPVNFNDRRTHADRRCL